MAVIGAFLYGLETDTKETIENRTRYMINADIDAMQTTVITPLPGTAFFERMQNEDRLIYNNFPDDWAHYDFVEVVFKPKLMTAEGLSKSIYSAWKTLYDDKRLKRKFIDALRLTKNPISATWSYNSDLHYHSLVFEHKKEKLVRNVKL
jgi:radical SAM superfamily enzyme YgiQ (UPF0313 family)